MGLFRKYITVNVHIFFRHSWQYPKLTLSIFFPKQYGNSAFKVILYEDCYIHFGSPQWFTIPSGHSDSYTWYSRNSPDCEEIVQEPYKSMGLFRDYITVSVCIFIGHSELLWISKMGMTIFIQNEINSYHLATSLSSSSIP